MSGNLSPNTISNENQNEKKKLNKTYEYKEKLQKTLSLPSKDTPQTTCNIRKVKTKI